MTDNGQAHSAGAPSNKGMKLTKLSAAREHGRLVWLSSRCRLMPAPPRLDTGTSSQLIPGVRRTVARASRVTPGGISVRGMAMGAWLLLAVAATAVAEQAGQPTETPASFGQKWIATRLVVGARFTHYWLEDSRRAGENGYDNGNLEGNNFLGSLWGLDAHQHYFPNPYVEYRVVSGLGFGVTYDQLRAKTLDWADEEQTATAGDGDLEIRGVGIYLLGRYRNRTRFEPYGILGFTWYKSHFDVSPGWAAPGRRFEVENTDGWFMTAGCTLSLTRHFSVDVMFRHSQVEDVAARAYFRPNRYREGAFPMHYDALAFGGLYAF
jgi:opacity protein-like surface antigen